MQDGDGGRCFVCQILDHVFKETKTIKLHQQKMTIDMEMETITCIRKIEIIDMKTYMEMKTDMVKTRTCCDHFPTRLQGHRTVSSLGLGFITLIRKSKPPGQEGNRLINIVCFAWCQFRNWFPSSCPFHCLCQCFLSMSMFISLLMSMFMYMWLFCPSPCPCPCPCHCWSPCSFHVSAGVFLGLKIAKMKNDYMVYVLYFQVLWQWFVIFWNSFFRKPEFVPNFVKNLNNWNVAFRVSSKFVPNLGWSLQSFFKVCSKLGMEHSEFLQSLFQTWNGAFNFFSILWMFHSKFVTNFEWSIQSMEHSKFVTNFECSIPSLFQTLNASFQAWNKLWRNSEGFIPSLEQTLKKLWRHHSKFVRNFEETLRVSFQVCKKLWRNSEGFIPSS